MSHQPFETWLFMETDLEGKNRQSLDAHLKECVSCQNISIAMKEVKETFTYFAPAIPAPGFTQRWHAHLAEFRYKTQQRNLWYLTLSLFAAAGLVFLIVLLDQLSLFSWIYILSQLIAKTSRSAAQVAFMFSLFRLIITTYPILLPITLIFGLGLFFTVFVLMITWFSSMINLFSPNYKGAV